MAELREFRMGCSQSDLPAWVTVANVCEELLNEETKTLAFKSLYQVVVPEYPCYLFTRNSWIASHHLRDTRIDLRRNKSTN